MKVTSVYIIVQNKLNKILLSKRADIPLWVLPGGHVEENELAEVAALREFHEETGLKTRIKTTIACYKNIGSRSRKYLFLGELTGGKKTLSNETVALKWVDLNHLPSPMTIYERRKIEDFINYRNKIIIREDKINMVGEIVSQIKNPIIFGYLLYRLIKLLIF